MSRISKGGSSTIVVFDGYGGEPSTKDHEHQRRSVKVMKLSPDITYNEGSKIVTDQHAFLANEKNKNQFIAALISTLSAVGISAMQGQGDADTDIVSQALHCATNKNQSVAVFVDDTDILVMLVSHYRNDMQEIYFVSDVQTKSAAGKQINISQLQQSLSPGSVQQLLVINAIGGCDTVSAMFGHGKASVF